MREIKFRVWNLLGKDWDYFTLRGLAEDETIDWRHYESWCQSTGLKDKNGKEIYEGDIFDCIYLFDGCKKHKLKVVWQENTGRFWLENIGECHQPNVTKTISDMIRSKVIGNKFENPELLK